MNEPTPEVLFVCTHNAGRSVAARVLLDHYAQGRLIVRSAGTDPARDINPSVVAILTERGLDATKEYPKPLTTDLATGDTENQLAKVTHASIIAIGITNAATTP
jgi:protein-tyrosine-phosphatase